MLHTELTPVAVCLVLPSRPHIAVRPWGNLQVIRILAQMVDVRGTGYVGSMGATLYAALVMHSYVMSLVCCAAQARPTS